MYIITDFMCITAISLQYIKVVDGLAPKALTHVWFSHVARMNMVLAHALHSCISSLHLYISLQHHCNTTATYKGSGWASSWSVVSCWDRSATTHWCTFILCVLQCVAVCCSVLRCVAVCCSVLLRVAVCCSVLQRVAVYCSVEQCGAVCCGMLWCVAAYCSVLQRVASWCSMLQRAADNLVHIRSVCVAVRCSVLQRVCSLLQCVASCCSMLQTINWYTSISCVLQCLAVCCSVLQCVAVCCSVLLCVADK